MENISAHLQNKFTVRKARSPDQEQAWNRADAVIEVTKWLYLAEVMQLTAHLQPHQIINLMDYAKKHGEKPRHFFRYLVREEYKRLVEAKKDEEKQMPLV